MKLIEPFEYVAANGRRWPVPAGTIVDGASIPKLFWSIIGGPFEGAYRSASVIHDFYCDVRTRRHEDVHLCFYEAMITSGVGRRRAWLMYKAVATFGPYWPKPIIPPECEVVTETYDFNKCAFNFDKPRSSTPDQSEEKLLRFISEVQDSSDPADIETLRRAIAKTSGR